MNFHQALRDVNAHRGRLLFTKESRKLADGVAKGAPPAPPALAAGVLGAKRCLAACARICAREASAEKKSPPPRRFPARGRGSSSSATAEASACG
eukprot:6493472-Pyramimonas_sp.AAC.1